MEMSPERSRDSDRRVWATALAVAAVAVVAYLPALGGGFVWDDLPNLQANGVFGAPAWDQVAWAWRTDYLGVYQPLGWWLFEAEYAAWGLDPRGYHLVSLVLHAAVAVALFLLAVALLRRCRPAASDPDPRGLVLGAGLAVALYAAHPLRAEVVAWASCQPYLACALFATLSCLAYVRADHDGGQADFNGLALAFVLYGLALLSKAPAVGLPLVFLILDVYPLGRLKGRRWTGPAGRELVLEKLPFLALGIYFMLLAARARVKAVDYAPLTLPELPARLAQAGYSAAFYVIKSVLPLGITAGYPVPDRADWIALLIPLAVLGAAGVAVLLRVGRRCVPAVVATVAAYLVLLAPTSGLVRAGTILVAARYAELPTMAWVVLLAAALARLVAPTRRPRAAAMVVAAGLGAVLILTVLSWGLCRAWRSNEALWSHAVAHGAGRNATVHYNLGGALARRGDLQAAEAHYREAVRLDPAHAQARNALGALLLNRGRIEEGEALCAEAVRLRPDLAEAHSNLGFALLERGQTERAIAELREALRLNPALEAARINLDRATKR